MFLFFLRLILRVVIPTRVTQINNKHMMALFIPQVNSHVSRSIFEYQLRFARNLVLKDKVRRAIHTSTHRHRPLAIGNTGVTSFSAEYLDSGGPLRILDRNSSPLASRDP
jgi:hypothetical protein